MIPRRAVLPVPAGEGLTHFQRAADALDREERREWMKNAAIKAAAWLFIPGTLSGWVYRANFPLRIVEEKHIPYGPHNVPLAAFGNAADAAAGVPGDAALQSVWRFVEAMEGYDANRENEGWAIATQMADKALAEAYQRVRAPTIKTSPVQRFKRRYSIVLQRDTEIDVCDADERNCGANINGYAVRYHRVVYDNQLEAEIERILCEAVVRFRRNVPGFTTEFVRRYNPLRIQVHSYTRGQPLAPINTKFPIWDVRG